jgi:hypothetical protein
MKALLIAGVIGLISAAWADHIAFFFPFDYWQWKSKLFWLRNNPNYKDLNLKDKKIRQKLAWEKSVDRKKLNESMD